MTYLTNDIFDIFGVFNMFDRFDIFDIFDRFDIFDIFDLYITKSEFDIYIPNLSRCFIICIFDIFRKFSQHCSSELHQRTSTELS